MHKLYALLVLLMLAPVTLMQAQQTEQPAAELSTTEWKTIITEQNVKVEYRFANCDMERGMDQQIVILRITNSNAQAVKVDWDLELFYNDVCKTCGFDEYHRTYNIPANGVIEGKCTAYDTQQLTIHVKFLVEEYAKEILTNFKLANMKVTIK